MSDPFPPPDGPRPCAYMTTLLSALADGSLTGIARWYAVNHAKGCPGCSATLASLTVLRERLHALGVPPSDSAPPRLSSERRAQLEAAMDAIDRKEPRTEG